VHFHEGVQVHAPFSPMPIGKDFVILSLLASVIRWTNDAVSVMVGIIYWVESSQTFIDYIM